MSAASALSARVNVAARVRAEKRSNVKTRVSTVVRAGRFETERTYIMIKCVDEVTRAERRVRARARARVGRGRARRA